MDEMPPPAAIVWALYESRDPETGQVRLGVGLRATLADGTVLRNGVRLNLEGFSEALAVGRALLRTWLEECLQRRGVMSVQSGGGYGDADAKEDQGRLRVQGGRGDESA